MAQTTIDCANLTSGPYAPGSSISIPIKTSAIIVDNANEFQIYLTNGAGSEQLIGSYKGIYTTSISGTIPTGLAAGTYQVRVKTTNPVAATAYCTITVKAGTVVTAGASGSSLTTLDAGSFFGWCGENKANRALTLNNISTSGATVEGVLIDNLTGVATVVPLSGSTWNIILPNTTDYTFIVKAEKNGVVATKAYTIINNTFNMTLSNYSQSSGCIPFVSTLGTPLVGSDGIANNYKGTQYRVDWGDGTVEFYTYRQLMDVLSGKITHTYHETSCGMTDNSFKVNVTFLNPFNSTSCPSTNMGTNITVFRKPEADFAMPTPVCVNKDVTITNTSVIGNGNMSSTCQAAAVFTWWVNGTVVYTSPAPESTAPSLKYKFTKSGKYEIRLDVENLPCGVDTKKDSICVEDPVNAAFTLSYTGNCIPLVVKTDTVLDKTKFYCKDYGQAWLIQVQNASGAYITAPSSYYKVLPSSLPAVVEPTFRFDTAGLYRIRYTVSNSCGSVSSSKDLVVRQSKVSLPADQIYCDLQTLKFAKNTVHEPVYSTSAGTPAPTYVWSVAGGTSSFVNGTSANSAYPEIKFDNYAQYTVTVTYTTECGTSTASQKVTFSQPVTASIIDPANDIAVCYNTVDINLKGKSTGGAVASVTWSKDAGSNGTFTNTNTDNTVYKFGAKDRQNGSVKIIYTVSPVNKICPDVKAERIITIHPENVGLDAKKEICSNAGMGSYQPVSSVSTSTFTWTAALVYGSASGYKDQATATTSPINDNIVNNSNSDTAVVVYTIVPYANGCAGESYKLRVKVYPIPQLTVSQTKTRICSGEATDLKLESTVKNTYYEWASSVVPAGKVTGNTSQGTTDASNIVTIKDVLQNTSFDIATVTYVIQAKGPIGCASPTTTKTVEVWPKVTQADAGSDQKLCKVTEAKLAGNNPNVGKGTWTQTGGPTVSIDNPAAYDTKVTGLQEGNEYKFTWTITSDVCTLSSDEVVIYNRPEVSTPEAGTDQVYCNYLSTTTNYVTLAATPLTRTYEKGTWTVSTQPTGSNYNFSDLHDAKANFYFNLPGTYVLVWTVSGDATCTPKSDLVTLSAYETPATGAVLTGTPNVCAGADIDFNLSSYKGNIEKWQYNADPVHSTVWKDTAVTNSTIRFLNVQDTFEVRVVVRSNGYNSVCSATSTTAPIRVYVSAKTIGGQTGQDETVCKDINVGSIALTGHLGTVTGWQTSVDNGATWVNIGRANNTTITYSNLAQTTWFRALVKNGDCNEVASDITKITIVSPVSDAKAGSDQNLCNVSTTTLTANTPLAGEKGTWTQIGGPNTAGTTNVNNPKITLSGLVTGIYQFTWTVENGICPVKTSNVAVSISASAIGGTTLGSATYCKGTDNNTVSLSGYYGSITKWQSSVDGGTTWTDIAQTQASLRYNNLPQTTMFRAEIINGFCTVPVYSTPATITIKPAVTVASAGADQELCNLNTATLEGNTPASGETGTWSQVSGPNTAITTDLNKPRLELSGLVHGTYKFKWEIDNAGTCPVTNDEVVIEIYPPLVNKIDNTPVVVCEGQLVKISSQEVSGGKGTGTYTFQWQYSDDNQVTWKDFGLNANFVEFNFIGTKSIFVRRHVISTPCDTYSDPTEITVQAGLSNNTLSSDESLCINTAAAGIQGSLPAGGDGIYLYVWEQSIDNGNTWSVIAGANSQNYDPGVLTQTTLYRRQVSTALCFGPQNSTSNTITKKVNPDAHALFTALKTNGCAPFTIDSRNISASEFSDRNDIYTWKADDKIIGTGVFFPGYTLIKEDDSVVVKLVVTSLYGCKPDSLQLKFYSSAPAEPSFTVSSDNSCGPVKIKFTNTSPSSSRMIYNWNFGNGQTSTAYDPGEVDYDIHPDRKDTTYFAKLAVTTACTTEEFTVPIKIKAKPQAAFTPSKTSGCSPFRVVFTNNSMGERTTYTWSFDDGSPDTVTTSTGIVEHTFITYTPQTYKVKLVATNECGSDELIYNLVVSPNTVRLNMAANGDERIGCAPLKVNFNNNSRGANAFHWDFGDGNQLNTTTGIETITHEFTQPGKYQITLVASNGCSDTTGYENVEVLATPKVAFTAVPDEVCIGDSITFRNESDPVTGLTWSFGDGKSSTLTDPRHAYTAANTYNVTMEGAIQYAGGISCKASVSKPVKVIPSLPGDFTASTLLGECVPFTITFTNTTKPSALTKWNFGDGNHATGDVVTHTYTANGDYTVTMEALHPHGCTYIASKTVEIKGPEGQFSYDFGYICKDKPVRFEAYAVRTTGYTWVFGDGDTLVTNDNVVYHVYKQAGTYTPSVQLRRNDCGIWLRGQDQIKVDYYKAGFSQVQQQGCGNSVIAFQDTSRSAFGIAARAWDFGDGGTSTSAQPQHTYTSTNSWPVTLIITGVSGCKDTVTTPVYAQPHRNPKAAIVNNATGCVQQDALYTAVVTSDDPVTLYSWSFSNGTTADGVTVKNKYATSGIHQATLITGTEYGCYDTVKSPITIYPTPVIGISKDVTICKGQSAQLGAAGATTVAWTPTEGLSCTSCANPVASPAATTQYVISGMNNYGCVSSDSVTVNVIQPSKISVSPNDTICVGQSAQLKAEGAYRYTWTPAVSLSVSSVAAPVASPVLTTTYRVEGTDEKNCFRDVATITITVGNWPKVSLGPDKILPTGTELQLASTVTNGPITKWSWAPAKDLSCADCALPVATIKKDACYTVTAENVFHCEAKDTICITSFCENTQVFIPNAFVPTGTSNNILMVRGKGIKQVKSFRIFNRWGQMVFDKANFPPNEKAFGWDGRVNGVPASPEVYVYTCEVICEDDKMFTYKGNVAILK